MAFITAAIIGAGGAALGGIAGGIIQGNAASSAADKQAAAAAQATALQKQVYGETRQDNQPYLDAGKSALSQMQDPSFQHSFGMADYQADPGYAFRLQQGQQALERSAAARGGLQSGGTLKGLTGYAQGMASQEYQSAYDRFNNDQNTRFGRLSNIAGMGQNAIGINSGAGQNYANSAGNNMMGSANAQGAAGIAAGNQWGSTLSGLGSGLGGIPMQAKTMGMVSNWLSPGAGAGASSGGGGGGSPFTYGVGLAPMTAPTF